MDRSIILIVFGLFAFASSFGAPPSEEGKEIFSSRCAACHSVNKTLTGPALAGVKDRRSMEWIISFVQSSQTVIKSGDKEAVALFEKFNKIPMPDHKDLSADDIKNIVAYIDASTVSTSENKAPFKKPNPLRPNYMPLTFQNSMFFGSFFVAVALLVVSLLALVKVKDTQRQKTN